MKFYSWNMYFRNTDLDRAFLFIQTLEFDVLCLQEVPEEFLERLKTLPREIAYGKEFDFTDRRAQHTYCVILSKHPILAHRDFALPKYVQSSRTKAFVRMMHPLGWRLATNRRSLFADIEMPALGRVRIFCLHLTLSHPLQRAAEFTAAIELRDMPAPTIVCGDFNVLEHPRVTILNWILGGRVRDIFAWRSERKNIEERFIGLKLQNPLRGMRMQTISHSQLDHILVPLNFPVARAEVLPDRCGSDHHPVFVELEAPALAPTADSWNDRRSSLRAA